jgi:hypothetical protein
MISGKFTVEQLTKLIWSGTKFTDYDIVNIVITPERRATLTTPDNVHGGRTK